MNKNNSEKILASQITDANEVLPTNYIYVGKGGSDTAGDGSANIPYLTVQKAINEASAGTTLFIFPGTYSENITFKAGVNLTSSAILGVYITGNHTANFTGTVIVQNIVLNSATGNTLTFSGTGNKNLQFYNSSINSTSGYGINWTNTNSSSKINFLNCTLNVSTSGASAKAIYSTTGATGGIIANTTTFKVDNANNICLDLGGAVTFTHTADTITGQVVINGTASATIGNVAMTTTSVPCLVTNSSGTVTLLNVIATSGGTYAFDGTTGSIIVFMGILYGSTAAGANHITAVPLLMAPIRIRANTLYSAINPGIIQFDGNDLYIDIGTKRYTLNKTEV